LHHGVVDTLGSVGAIMSAAVIREFEAHFEAPRWTAMGSPTGFEDTVRRPWRRPASLRRVANSPSRSQSHGSHWKGRHPSPAICSTLRNANSQRRGCGAARRFLAEAQHLSLTGSFFWRFETGEFTWSEQLYRIFEFEQGVPITFELIGSRYHPEDIPLLNDVIDQTRRAVSDFDYEHRLLMPDQSIKYVHVVAHGNPDKDGQLEYVGAVQDVTQRRRAEASLGKARSELAHVTRVTSLGVLTASIAHEVNQPLSGIITNAGTCLRMLAANPPNVDGARETARRTIRDGNRASDVITRLRALFAKKNPTIEPVDFNEATLEVIRCCGPNFREAG
jgi:signal transduction histidine kinase